MLILHVFFGLSLGVSWTFLKINIIYAHIQDDTTIFIILLVLFICCALLFILFLFVSRKFIVSL